MLEGRRNHQDGAVHRQLVDPVLPNETVSVHYATANGTAIGGSDYDGRTGTPTLPVGASSGTVAVTVRGDATVEATEQFTLNLSAPIGAVLADALGRRHHPER